MEVISRRAFWRNFLGIASIDIAAAQEGKPEVRSEGSYIDFTTLGGVPNNPAFDNAPILNAAIAQSIRRLFIPVGIWTFRNMPDAITHPMEIVGAGMGLTKLVRSYRESNPLNGLLNLRASNSRVERLGVLADAKTTGGSGISLVASPSLSPDFSVFEDLYISQMPESKGTWENAFHIDGTKRIENPIGVRAIAIRNCYLFSSTNAACRINGAVVVNILGGGMFPAGGSTGRLQITGSSQVPSHYICSDVPYVGGISVDNCNYANLKCAVIAGDITNTSSANGILVSGGCSGSVQKLWTRGHHDDPGIRSP